MVGLKDNGAIAGSSKKKKKKKNYSVGNLVQRESISILAKQE
jgi:hypothetical protein